MLIFVFPEIQTELWKWIATMRKDFCDKEKEKEGLAYGSGIC